MSTKEIVSPKGKLIIIGGNEAKKPPKNLPGNEKRKIDFENGVLDEVLMEVKKKNPVIEIIPLASEDQEAMSKKYEQAFSKLKQKSQTIFIKSRKEADKEEYLDRISRADLIFFTGGDQEKIQKTIVGTKFFNLLKKRYENEEVVIAGTSSGAMVMSDSMILSGDGDESVLKGLIESKKGLGMISNVIIDTHFLSRGRISRLAESLLIHSEDIGIGLCEDTGAVITEGRFLRVFGSGTVIIMEGNNIRKTNYQKVKEFEPVYIENITMHVLAQGAGYDLNHRRFLVLEEKLKKESADA